MASSEESPKRKKGRIYVNRQGEDTGSWSSPCLLRSASCADRLRSRFGP